MSRQTRSNSTTQVDNVKQVSLKEMEEFFGGMKDEIMSSMKSEFGKLSLQITNLTCRIDYMEKKLESACAAQQNHGLEINRLKTSVSFLEEQCASLDFHELQSELMSEWEDRSARRDNVIFFGVLENNGSVQERVEHDKRMVKNICEALNVVAPDMSDFRRLGKASNGKPRPLKVTIHNRTARQNILRQSKLLKGHKDFDNVFLSVDRTRYQQNEWYNLRQELKARRNNENVVIYKG